MSDPSKLIGLLGMARRAGRLSIGFDAAIGAAEGGKTALILLADDASPKTAKECAFAAETYGVRVMLLPLSKTALADAIGMHKPVAVLAVCDSGFAKAIVPIAPKQSKEEYSL